MHANPQHLSLSAERFTPPEVVEAVRSTMGGIDLDPASCAAANTVVKADKYFTTDDDGLTKNWFGRVFNNPPGSRCGSMPKRFWAKGLKEFSLGHATELIYLGFSLEQLASLQGSGYRLDPFSSGFPICVFNKRIRFLDEHLQPLTRPTHGNFAIFLCRSPEAVKRFIDAFSKFGAVR